MNIFTIKQTVNNNITNGNQKIFSNNEHVLNLKKIILLKTISATTINHRLLMLKTFYIKGLTIEHSITQLTYLKIYTNIQLMLLIVIKPTRSQI